MLISLTNRHAVVVRATPEERQFLREYLSFPDPKGHWKGKSAEKSVHRMYNEVAANFASGFLAGVKKAAAFQNIKVDVVDNRVVPVVKDPEADIAWLRDYQREAIDACLLKGRGIIWHPMGCLAGDTKLIVNRGGLARPFELSTIVSRLHGEATKNRAGRTCSWDLNIPSFTQSVDDDGFLRLNEIVSAHDNGIKPVFAVVLVDGRTIRATEEHRFRTPDGAWVRLHELREGHEVMAATWPKSMSRQVRRTTTYRQVAHMRAHPFVQITNSARDGHLFLVPFHRLVAEARENRISTYELIGRVLLGEIDGLTFFDPAKLHVHHKDEDTRNNSPDNLEVLDAEEHLRLHGKTDGWKHVAGRVSPVRVARITACGSEHVYDLTMAAPMSNYVANEFLVHNSGKSEVQVALTRALPCSWLMLAPSLSLVNNVADRFLKRNREHGIDLGEPGRIGEGVWTEGERLTCATYQSIERSLNSDRCRALLARVGGLMADECFPAGTLVDGRPIESFRTGDAVTSYDEVSEQLVQRRVLDVFSRAAPTICRVYFEDDRQIVCTTGHPFLTREGWQTAGSLYGKDVLCFSHDMRHLREDVHPLEAAALRHQEAGNDVSVFQSVSTGSKSTERGRARDARGSHAGEEPDAGHGHSRQDERSSAAAGRLAPAGARWERHGTVGPATVAIRHARQRLVDGACRSDENAATVPVELQDRHCEPEEASCDRGGRGDTQGEAREGARRAQGPVSRWARVVRVEILEPRDREKRERVCPGGLVYNLHVEGTETYLVNGAVVHNCHVVPAITFLEATASCDAYYRFGFSGTPLDRTDMKSALAIAALGPVIHKVPASRLVASKDIAKARCRFTTFRHPMPDGFTYADVYRELVIESAPRNALLVNLAKLAEKPAILFVRNIDHGRALTSMLGRAGVKAQFVWGTHKAPQINHFVKELTRGALDVIVASAVMKQGFDIPSLRSVLFGGSGASITDTLQKLGRGSRIERDAAGNIIKDEFTVYDVYDVGEQWLEKHSAARKRAMLREGYEVVIEGERPRAAAARRAAISWRQE